MKKTYEMSLCYWNWKPVDCLLSNISIYCEKKKLKKLSLMIKVVKVIQKATEALR